MRNTMLHIFRNSPLGRENLLQSAYFCKKHRGLSLKVYIPKTSLFSIDVGSDLFFLQLDASYLQYPYSAEAHVKGILQSSNVSFTFVGPNEFDVGVKPHLPGSWSIIACPRVISEQSGRIGLGHLGPKVRGLVKAAYSPVFIPSLAHKEWTSVTAFFGGSSLGALSVKMALAIARFSFVPASVHTQLNGMTKAVCEKALSDAGILAAVSSAPVTWRLYDTGELKENLYDVPHDSLVVVGAAGKNVIKELVFGSTLEAIQSALPNPLVVVGPRCKPPWEELPKSSS